MSKFLITAEQARTKQIVVKADSNQAAFDWYRNTHAKDGKITYFSIRELHGDEKVDIDLTCDGDPYDDNAFRDLIKYVDKSIDDILKRLNASH